jgi:hypothetical protein
MHTDNGETVILDLCGGTGSWARPYEEAGYRVVRVTLPDGDVRLTHWLPERVHGVLAAPPCTVFANSGARWPRTREQMIEALSVVDACLRAVVIYEPAWWALENPVGKLKRWLGPPALYFDPCDYGDPYRKKTALWGRFAKPALNPVVPVEKSPIHWMPPGPERAAKRSVTPAGFAQAFFEANP